MQAFNFGDSFFRDQKVGRSLFWKKNAGFNFSRYLEHTCGLFDQHTTRIRKALSTAPDLMSGAAQL
jgi:hypothetical protein